MSRIRFTKISQPANPPTNTGEVYFDTTINGPCMVDSGGNRTVLGTMGGNNSYRLVGFTLLTVGSSTYNSQAHGPATAFLIEAVGGGGAGGSAIGNTTPDVGAGGGGGGGAYCKTFVTLATLGFTTANGTAIPYTVGAGGNNAAGSTTTFNNTTANYISVVGGAVGGNMTTAVISGSVAGGAGGAVGSTPAVGNNCIQLPGGAGGAGIVLSATVLLSGAGGDTPIGFGGVGIVQNTTSNGTTGGVYGGGGSGALKNSSANATETGANGGAGGILIWEYVGV